MADTPQRFPAYVRCTACRWRDIAYTKGHFGAYVKLGHKVNRETNGQRCEGSVVSDVDRSEQVTDDRRP